jgi:isopentenyl-diphosphate delta-isomerase
MAQTRDFTSQRKKEHIEICLTDDASFREKTTGFERYEFLHYAITEIDLSEINFNTHFQNRTVSYPFIISCMTGGTPEAENINAQLAEAAAELNIPLGVGSQRQSLENSDHHDTYRIIRQKAPKIPVMGNIGAAQLVKINSLPDIRKLADMVEADVMVVHLNAAQELMQYRSGKSEGEPYFKGLLKALESLSKLLDIPVFVKEVGAGISRAVAEKLLNAGVKGIDVAGAGGTSWTAVEALRNKEQDSQFWDWGLPTSYCLHTVNELRENHNFVLIGSGGINSSTDAAKAYALGADYTASARIILQQLDKHGVEGIINLIKQWFKDIKGIMFLTGSKSLNELKNNKLVKKEELY